MVSCRKAARATALAASIQSKKTYTMSKREERAKNARLAPANSTDPVLIVKAKAAADEVKSVKAR